MLLKNDEGYVIATTLSPFTAWRRRWQTAWRQWEAARSARAKSGRSLPSNVTDLVRLTETVSADGKPPAEGEILFIVPSDDAYELGMQDAQFSATNSLDGALVDFFKIIDPEHLHPSKGERAKQALRAGDSLNSLSPVALPWGGFLGIGAGLIGSFVGVGLAEVYELLLPIVGAGAVGGGFLGSIPYLRHGNSERLLGAKFVKESNALYLAARAWIITVELRRLVSDGEVELLANQMRRILWDAAGYLDKHDRNIPIDFSRWDGLETELESVNDALDALLDRAQVEDQPTADIDGADSITAHNHLLGQSHQQLESWLKALDDTDKEDTQGKGKP